MTNVITTSHKRIPLTFREKKLCLYRLSLRLTFVLSYIWGKCAFFQGIKVTNLFSLYDLIHIYFLINSLQGPGLL